MEKSNNIVVIGLGYVGMTLSVALASKGFHVVGIEKRKSIVDQANQGKPSFSEIGLQVKLSEVVENGLFKAVHKFDSSHNSDVFIITVGTPLDDKGEINLSMIENVTHQIGKFMPDDALIVVRSTVKIGTCDKIGKILDSYNKLIK